MIRLTTWGIAVLVTAVLAGQATASYVIYTDAAVPGFVPDSSVGTPAFGAAIGVPDEFISFSLDKFGNPTTSGSIDGALFSDNVIFSTSLSLIGFGGATSTDVLVTGAGPSSEIGPVTGYDGVLNIDFLAGGNTASIVGFGTVEFGTLEAIRVYDQNNSLAATYFGLTPNFGFFGIAGTGGMLIGRIELDGGFFAIQDIQFDFARAGGAAVPEPASLTLFGFGLVGIAIGRLRRRNA